MSLDLYSHMNLDQATGSQCLVESEFGSQRQPLIHK